MGFANPGALLLSALLAALVFLYLWERQQRRLDVPSFLLWEKVPDAVVSRSRFQADPLFFLQLAILSALIVGLADPFLSRRGEHAESLRQIIVLDTSASMQTREADATRFAQAKRAIGTRVAALDPRAEVMLVAVANRPIVAMPFSSDRRLLETALAGIDPQDTGTNLDGALALALRAAAASDIPTRIDLFTDLAAQDLDARWQDRINVWPFGATDDNLALDSLRVFQGSFQSPRETRAQVSVRNHSAREAHGILTISVADTLVSRQLFTIPPRAARDFSAGEFPAGGLVRAHLDVDDALPVDNTALAWIRTPRRLTVLFVSPPSPLRGELEAIAGAGFLDVAFQSPAEYQAAPRPADVVVFHRFVPAALPPQPCLVVHPDTDAAPFAAQGQAENLEILAWNAAHPALRGLHLHHPYPLARTRLLPVPEWAEPLLQARADERTIALGFAGELAQRRVAVLTFDLEAEGLLATDHENLLLLVLNLLAWLGSDETEVQTIRTGDVLPARAAREAVEVVDPRQRVQSLGAARRRGVDALLAGRYELRSAAATGLVLANFSDARESDIGRARPSPQRAAAPEGRALLPTPASGFGRTLLVLAAALLLLEWVMARRAA